MAPVLDGRPDKVLVTLDGAVMSITLNRPEASNAVDLDMTHTIGDALESAHHDDAVRAVVLTGAGDRVFCAGTDLRARARGEQSEPTEPHRRDWGFAGFVRHPIDKPVIVAINGAAVAGGAELVLASDLALAASTASLSFPEVKVGLFAGAGGGFRLPRQIPPKLAIELMLTGEPVSADRAVELGLVNRTVPAGELLREAMALARLIAEQSADAVLSTLRVARGMVGRELPHELADWDLTQAEVARIEGTADAREGSVAFVDKRRPRWSDKSDEDPSRARDGHAGGNPG